MAHLCMWSASLSGSGTPILTHPNRLMFFNDPHIVERNIRESDRVGWLGEELSSFMRFGSCSLFAFGLIGRLKFEELANKLREVQNRCACMGALKTEASKNERTNIGVVAFVVSLAWQWICVKEFHVEGWQWFGGFLLVDLPLSQRGPFFFRSQA